VGTVSKHRGQVDSTPASYLGGHGFKSLSGDRVSSLRFLFVLEVAQNFPYGTGENHEELLSG
jgi:hypothetical protein